MKHTKRPWIVNVWTTGRRTIEPYPTKMGSVHPIAEIHIQHNEEHIANSYLIAAAPELLEALIDAQAHLEYCDYGDKYERDHVR